MIAKPECLLGVDLGTGGCKLTLVDAGGSIIGSSFTEYKTYYPHHGWSEQNPEDWYQTFLVTMARLMRETGLKGSNIIALAVDASTHNAVLIGKQGRVLRPCIMWTDQRSVHQVQGPGKAARRRNSPDHLQQGEPDLDASPTSLAAGKRTRCDGPCGAHLLYKGLPAATVSRGPGRRITSTPRDRCCLTVGRVAGPRS